MKTIQPFAKVSLFVDLKKRINYSNNEIFFDCCSLLNQSKFSNSLFYFFFKRRNNYTPFSNIKNRCVSTGYPKSVSSQLKMSRIVISKKILNGSIHGYFKSIW